MPALRSIASNAAGSLLPTTDHTGEHTVYVFFANVKFELPFWKHFETSVSG